MITKLIAPERIEAVTEAIWTTCNTTQPDEFTPLEGGYSASQTYRVLVRDKPYVLRVMGLDQALPDREQQIQCLRLAAAENLAPACYYADAKSGIVMMEYIESVPYEATQTWLTDMANILRNLHGIAAFPTHHLISVFSYMNGLIAGMKAYPLSRLLSNYLEHIHTLKNNLTPYLTKTSTHNDLNPNNVLFNGKKIYLIDWEAAGFDDPFIDIATVCNYFIFEPSLQTHFLQSYFGQSPNAEQREKLQGMRQISYAFCGLHFLGFAASAGLSLLKENLDGIPDAFSWKTGYGDGTYSLRTPADFLLYGMVQVKMSLKQTG